MEINGDFPHFYLQNNTAENARKLIDVVQWGDNPWQSMRGAFEFATRLQISATDTPDLRHVADMGRMFRFASSFNRDISGWDVSNVTNMRSMFYHAHSFNQDIDDWDVGNVTDMSYMFYEAQSFNGDVSSWDVSNVTDMSNMFCKTLPFSGDLSQWDVRNVADMSEMFSGASSFNSDIGEWKVDKVTTMSRMFSGASSFNADLSAWDVSNVATMSFMFLGASSFNGDLSQWNVSNVTAMNAMFYNAASFNGNISDWDVGNVKTMSDMFYGATAFNGDLSDWDVGSVTQMNNMFRSATAFNQDIGGWDVSNVREMEGMFFRASSFNGDISDWHVSNVLTMEGMFYEAAAFDQNLGGWDIGEVRRMQGMLDKSGLSRAHYDATLRGWASLSNARENITLGAEGLAFCLSDTEREFLVNIKSWNIVGDTEDCTVIISPSSGNILYVNQSVSGGYGSGDSWANAIPEVADALKWAREQHGNNPNWLQNDSLQIYVAKGTYKPLYHADDDHYDTNGNRDNSFVIVRHVQLYGGFDPEIGIETRDDARILPSMANPEDGTILSGDLLGNDTPGLPGGSDPNKADNAYHVLVSAGDVGRALLDGLTVRGGYASGGGMDPIVVYGASVFRDAGGGLYISYTGLEVYRTHFTENLSLENGGAVYGDWNSSTRFFNSLFTHNRSLGSGGAVSFSSFYNIGPFDPLATRFINVLVADNVTANNGGGMELSGDIAISNATIYGNEAGNAGYGGGIFIRSGSEARIRNSILWGNAAQQGTELSSHNQTHVAVALSHTIFPEDDDALDEGDGITYSLEEIRYTDPLFVDTANGDFSLQPGSPAMNSGNNVLYRDAGGDVDDDFDLAGNPRLVGDRIDRGAYEFPLLPQAITADDLTKTYGDERFTHGSSDSELPLSYASDNTDVAVIDDDGMIEVIGAGIANITASQAGDDTYLPAEEVIFELTVQKAELTITADNEQGKVYGADDPELTYDVQGWQGTDGESLLSGKLGREEGEDVGTYRITLGNLSAGDNYGIGFEDAAFEILPADITGVTFDDGTFVYDGTERELAVSGELPSGAEVVYSDNGRTDVGTQTVTATVRGSNYNELVLTAELAVTPLGITVTAEDRSKVFGTSDPELTYTFTPELVGDDAFTGSLERDAGGDVGEYAIMQGDLSAGDNYTITFEPAALTIIPAVVTGVTLEDATFTYDGTARSLAISGELPDGAEVSYANNGRTDAGVQTVTATISGSNYGTLVLTAELEILPATPVISAMAIQRHVYAGSAKSVAAMVEPAELSSLLQFSPQQSFTGVGEHRVRVYLNESRNYLAAEAWVDFSITAAPQQGMQLRDLTVTYDGEAHHLSVEGLPGDAEVSYSGNGQVNAGSYTVSAIVRRPNHADTTLTGMLYINKASAVITADEKQERTFDGTAQAVAATLSHDEADLTYTPAGAYTDVGTYRVTVSASETANHHAAQATITLRILPAAQVDLSMQSRTTTYNGQQHRLIVEGLPADAAVVYTIDGAGGNSAVDAGEYEVIAVVSRPNHMEEELTGTLTINRAQAYILGDENQVHTYDGTTKVLATELSHGEATLSYAPSRSYSEAGTYPITVSAPASRNYQAVGKTFTLRIAPAPRTLDFPGLPEKGYGDADFAAGAIASSGEAVTYTNSNPAVAEVAADGMISIRGVGETTITATVAENANYSNRPEGAQVLRVRKAKQSITFNAPAEVNRDAGSIPLEVSASSGLPVVLNIDDEEVATLDGTSLNIHRLGTVNITAMQAGDANHEAAEPVTVTIRVTDPALELPIRVHRAVSPNGDGINEYLIIEAIKDYPDNRVSVFNRNGTVVYEASGYNNGTVAFRGIGTGQ